MANSALFEIHENLISISVHLRSMIFFGRNDTTTKQLCLSREKDNKDKEQKRENKAAGLDDMQCNWHSRHRH